eukprot:COSAG02_NODE_4889_length_4860_cov_4.713716_3_plen_171_part_00
MKKSRAQGHPACMQCRCASLSNHQPSYVNQGAGGCCRKHDKLLQLHLAQSRLPRSKRRLGHLRTSSLQDTCMPRNNLHLTPPHWRILDHRTAIACRLAESSQWPRIVNRGGCPPYCTAHAYSSLVDYLALHPLIEKQMERRRNWHQTDLSCRLASHQTSTGLPRKLHAAN